MLSEISNYIVKSTTKLFRYFFAKNKNAIEVGVIGSTSFFVCFTILLSALGVDLTLPRRELTTIVAAILGYLVFVELHQKCP